MPVMTAQQVQAECQRLAGRGVWAAAKLYTNLVKQELSVPAPRRLVTSGPRSRNPGTRYYRATTKASPGAPPRKLSGRLRGSIANEFDKDTNTARAGTNVIYAKRHERGTHQFLLPVLERNLAGLGMVAGQEMTAETVVKD